MVCKKCGNVLDKNDKYCGNCGQKVNGKILKIMEIYQKRIKKLKK